jgi:hypothetical protein
MPDTRCQFEGKSGSRLSRTRGPKGDPGRGVTDLRGCLLGHCDGNLTPATRRTYYQFVNHCIPGRYGGSGDGQNRWGHTAEVSDRQVRPLSQVRKVTVWTFVVIHRVVRGGTVIAILDDLCPIRGQFHTSCFTSGMGLCYRVYTKPFNPISVVRMASYGAEKRGSSGQQTNPVQREFVPRRTAEYLNLDIDPVGVG